MDWEVVTIYLLNTWCTLIGEVLEKIQIQIQIPGSPGPNEGVFGKFSSGCCGQQLHFLLQLLLKTEWELDNLN